jgi:hypothetical protein
MTQEAPETGGHFGAHIESETTMQVGTAWWATELVGITRMDPGSEPIPVDFSTG